MRKLNKNRVLSIALASMLAIMISVPAISNAAVAYINLGDASSFAVLAGSTITNTGTTTINGSAGGDVGLSPGSAITGLTSTAGDSTLYIADDTAREAKQDLLTAYNNAAGKTPITTIPSELGGTTLTPGVYDSADGTFKITGTLTLDGEGEPSAVFIFKTTSTLITASGSKIDNINSATSCYIYWAVGSSATLGTNSDFVGTIMASESITATTGAEVMGRLLALNGAVTLDTNKIRNNICNTTAEPEPIDEQEPVEENELVEEPETVDEPELIVQPETTYVLGALPATGAATALNGLGAILALTGFALFKSKK